MERPWTRWYMFPFIDYGDTRAALLADVVTVYTLGCRLLKRGATGADVKTLLGLLNQLGASLAVDGIFSAKTEATVKAFQKKAGIRVMPP